MEGWARRMTHPAYATVLELARWTDKSRFVANRLLKTSGLRYYDRARSYKFGRFVKWYVIPPPTLRAFLFARHHEIWLETMAEFPPSERTISPYAAYAGLLHSSSDKPVTPSLRWPSRRPTQQNAGWKRLIQTRRAPRIRRSSPTSS